MIAIDPKAIAEKFTAMVVHLIVVAQTATTIVLPVLIILRVPLIPVMLL